MEAGRKDPTMQKNSHDLYSIFPIVEVEHNSSFLKMWAAHSNLLSKSAIWKRGLGGQWWRESACEEIGFELQKLNNTLSQEAKVNLSSGRLF